MDSSVLSELAGKRVLVTGGTGLIGRQVVEILVDAGAVVRVVSLDSFRVRDAVEHLRGDLTRFDFCLDVTHGMDLVFHLAGVQGTAQTSVKKIASHFVPTLMMNTNVLEACRRNNVRKAIYTSSIGAYQDAEIFREPDRFDGTGEGPPMNFAGWAKRMGECQVWAYKVQYGIENFAIVRPAHVYGPGDNFDPATAMVIPSLLARIRAGENPLVVWGDGSAVRDFIYSRDAAEGIILALHHGTGGGFLNIGSGQGTSIRELVLTMRQFLEFDFRFDPGKPSGPPRRVMDLSLARTRLGFHPNTSLRKGLEETWAWYCSNPQEHEGKKNYFAES